MRGKRKSYGFYGEADGAQRRCGELDPGGDAYNCIINGNYAAAYFTLARLRVIIGIGALVIAHLKQMGAPAEPAAPKRPRTRNAGLTEYEMKIPAGSHVRSGGVIFCSVQVVADVIVDDALLHFLNVVQQHARRAGLIAPLNGVDEGKVPALDAVVDQRQHLAGDD